MSAAVSARPLGFDVTAKALPHRGQELIGKTFFFAGSESLLASHWPVRDDVAAVLTVRLFGILRADPRLSRAEALQRVEREIRNDTRDDPYLKSWSHPSAWAPFSLIGDVGR